MSFGPNGAAFPLVSDEDATAAVECLSYPDFVAFISQDNTPPFGAWTVLEWQQRTGINQRSRVLDLACSTGFSSRLLSQATDCSAVGIDRSVPAIKVASLRAAEHSGARPSYTVGDASLLPFAAATFSHIVAGSSFGFIQRRDEALKEVARVLAADGALCTASYFYTRLPPKHVEDAVAEAIGYRPDTSRTRERWIEFFERQFCLLSETTRVPECTSDDQVERSAHHFVFRESKALSDAPLPWQVACFRRLSRIRKTLNAHRAFQAVSVMHWAKR